MMSPSWRWKGACRKLIFFFPPLCLPCGIRVQINYHHIKYTSKGYLLKTVKATINWYELSQCTSVCPKSSTMKAYNSEFTWFLGLSRITIHSYLALKYLAIWSWLTGISQTLATKWRKAAGVAPSVGSNITWQHTELRISYDGYTISTGSGCWLILQYRQTLNTKIAFSYLAPMSRLV